MIETEIDRMLEDMEGRLRYQGIGLDQYLQIIGKTRDEMRKEYEETAKESVKSRLVLEKIAEKENIVPEEKQIKEKLDEFAKAYNRTEEELRENKELVDFIEKNLKLQNTIKFIVDNAKIK